MGAPLFTEEENRAFKLSREELDSKYRDPARRGQWKEHIAEEESLNRAQGIETARRVQARAEEFLFALTIVVGSRGARYIDFDAAFSESDSQERAQDFKKFNTPEARRDLYTILRALSEVPRSWSRSAFARFLRGTGKQKDAKYHGAGLLGADYGWTDLEVVSVCEVVAGHSQPYAKVLMSYADVQGEIYDKDPNFEYTDYDASFRGTRVDRDIQFLNKLCEMLEAQGLANIPKPSDKKPKKERKPKIFKPGDIIRRRDLRDLPLPAHIRVTINRRDRESDSQEWYTTTMEQVVVALGNSGWYKYLFVSGNKAYQPSYEWRQKDFLDGATFLGIWIGETRNELIRLNFAFEKAR